MKTKALENEQGVLKTKEGIEMKDHFLELGDEIVPISGYVIEKRRTAVVKDEEKVITSYKLRCKVRQNGTELVNADSGENDFIVTLTPTQAKSLKVKQEAGLELNQNQFVTYEYVNDYGKQIGLGLKREFKPCAEFR